MKKLAISVFFASILFLACNNPNANKHADSMNDSISNQNEKTATIENLDQHFAEKAAMGGIMEVEAGKIAVEKATNPDVKAFGQKMIDDHSKINESLKDLAVKKNMILPTMMSESQQKDLNDLRKKTGSDFDKQYVKMMVNDHKDDVDEFQKEVDKLNDMDLKNFAINTLPTLQTHLASIKQIEEKIK
jgi:putative membrane protein